ncbi:MAG: peptidoglycan editing factor PgeF [Clostridiales bacterium]|jgi:YfiH family protein|nr:peptidoglycan editing factor PgeF [Clostridiales bacterium]
MAETTGFRLHVKNDVWYYTISSFDDTGLVKNGFSTRKGGVSSGQYSTLNLGIKKSDSREAIRENFSRFCSAVGIDPGNMVFSDQVHGARVALVDGHDRGKGFLRDTDIFATDGLMTCQAGVALVTFYADCVPLFFLDPVYPAIALSHAGWRGTVAKIGAKTLAMMQETFGTRPEDCLVGIGPSIGPCCFEVDPPVMEEFAAAFPQNRGIISPGRKPGKYNIDLWEANRAELIGMGVPEKNVTLASICTCCNTDIFFSHRGDKGRTGSMAAILMLKE